MAFIAAVVVNAGGPYSSKINQLAFTEEGQNDLRVSLRALRQEVAYVPAPPGVNTDFIVMDLDHGFYARPDVAGKILVGGTEPKCDTLNWVRTEKRERGLVVSLGLFKPMLLDR